MIFIWRRPSKNENVTSSRLTPSDWPIEVRINRKQLDLFGSVPLFHVSPRFAFLRRLPPAFTTDYADSADSSLIPKHPCSSVTSVVKNSDSVFRVFRVFRGHSSVRNQRRLAEVSSSKLSFRFCDFPCFLWPNLQTVSPQITRIARIFP